MLAEGARRPSGVVVGVDHPCPPHQGNDRPQRLDVGHHDSPAGSHNAAQFPKTGPGVHPVVCRYRRNCSIERFVAKWQALGRCNGEPCPDPGAPRRGFADHPGSGVHAFDPDRRFRRRNLACKSSGPASDIEDALAFGGREGPENLAVDPMKEEGLKYGSVVPRAPTVEPADIPVRIAGVRCVAHALNREGSGSGRFAQVTGNVLSCVVSIMYVMGD